MGWMQSTRWQKKRLEILERDNYLCRVRGPKCQIHADQVDHIISPDDGGDRFDNSNLRAACHWCNTWRAQQQKSRHGWKRADTRIVLVTGPDVEQVSGYVKANASPSDLVVDWTTLANVVGGSVEDIKKVRGTLLTRIRRGDAGARRAWITSCNPKAKSTFPYHEVVSWWPEEIASREW